MPTLSPQHSRIAPIDDAEARDQAIAYLLAGELVAIPTETVYGLAVDATNSVAVDHLYAVKGRPSHNPLICHVADAEMVADLCDIPPAARDLMARFWPGPLTLVLSRRANADIASGVTAGLETLAVRCPALEATRTLIARFGKPIAAPSANPSGRLSPTSASAVDHLMDDRVALILDAGDAHVGIESTIIGVSPAGELTLLRPGSLSADTLAEACGQPVTDRAEGDAMINAPGQLKSHYAPRLPVRLNAAQAAPGEVMIGFGAITGDLSLSIEGDLDEAARRLYATLAAADQPGHSGIAVAPIPLSGVGIAINDRLERAAAPRPGTPTAS